MFVNDILPTDELNLTTLPEALFDSDCSMDALDLSRRSEPLTESDFLNPHYSEQELTELKIGTYRPDEIYDYNCESTRSTICSSYDVLNPSMPPLLYTGDIVFKEDPDLSQSHLYIKDEPLSFEADCMALDSTTEYKQSTDCFQTDSYSLASLASEHPDYTYSLYAQPEVYMSNTWPVDNIVSVGCGSSINSDDDASSRFNSDDDTQGGRFNSDDDTQGGRFNSDEDSACYNDIYREERFHLPQPGNIPTVCSETDSDVDSNDSLEGGKPIKKKPGRKKGQVSRVLHLWEFIRDLLKDPTYCGHIIKWEDKSHGIFRIVKSSKVAQLWGEKKRNKRKMTYEKMSRSLRYSRQEGYFGTVPKERQFPKKLCFKFGPKSKGWQ